MSFTVGTGVGMRYLGGKPPAASFSPSDLANLELWLQPSGLPASGSISSWTDDSGNGRDATQATGANQPTVAAGAINGLDAALFDGTNDILTTPAFSFGAFSWFWVWKWIGNVGIPLTHRSNADNDTYVYTGSPSIDARRSSVVSNRQSYAFGNSWQYNAHLFDGTHAGHRLRAGGSDVSPASNTANNPGTGLLSASFSVGGRSASSLTTNAEIAEVLVYSDEKSGADLSNLEAYLADKYAL